MSWYMVILRWSISNNLLHRGHPFSSIRIDREGQVHRIHQEEEIDVHDYQILTHEIIPTLKPLEEIIRENVFCLGGNRDHVPVCLCFMLYRVVHSKRFNLTYYMEKRMEWVTKQDRLILPYGMILTRLFKFIMNEYPELHNESYVLYDRVMNPLAAQLERKPRRDHGTRRGRHSTSIVFRLQINHPHLTNDDMNDWVMTRNLWRASTEEDFPHSVMVQFLHQSSTSSFSKNPNLECRPNMETFYTRQNEILHTVKCN
ncbi:hypothetical protein Tco_0826331 [Tanacetum coccineum]